MIKNSPFEILLRNENKVEIGLSAEEHKILAGKILESEAERPRLGKSGDFSGIYSEQELENDLQEVKRLEGRFNQEDSPAERNNRFLAKVLEIVIIEFGNSWLPGTFSYSAKYDDYKNGVDVIWEFENKDSYTSRMAIDLTTDERKVREKIESVLEELERGKFREVKYFLSESDETKGRKYMSRVIAGTDAYHARELAKLLVEDTNSVSAESRKIVRRKIANHPFGEQLITMITDQLDSAASILANKYPNADLAIKIMEIKSIKELMSQSRRDWRENKKTPAGVTEKDSENRILEAIETGLQDAISAARV